MSWQENLQTLDKLTTKEEKAICESEIVLDFMKTEVFTRLVKLKDELIEKGLIVELKPELADDIKVPDVLVEIEVAKTVRDTLKYSARFHGRDHIQNGSLFIQGEIQRAKKQVSAFPTILIASESISLIESYLKDFKDNFE
jgi:hypothetical protein